MSKFNSSEIDVEVGVRESMRILPQFCQPFLTWLTGKPLVDQKPLFKRSNLSHIVTAYACLLFGFCIATIGVINLNSMSLLALLYGWLFIVSGARKLATTINHYCVHEDFFPVGWKRFAKYHAIVAEINSVICFLQCFSEYRDEHVTHHQVKNVATIYDPDMIFMWSLGFRPGMDKKELWKNFYKVILNPSFHFLFLKIRIKSNFSQGSTYRKIAVALYLVILVLVAVFYSWQVIVFAWGFPLTILYHISALMQFSSEHRWLKDTDQFGKIDNLSQTDKVARSKTITVGRFFGERVPDTSNSNILKTVLLWVKWVSRMVFIHLTMRLFVLPGDLPQHDWHHRAKKGADWANAAYARQIAIGNLSSEEEPFIEVWGIGNAIDAVFDSLSKLPPLEESKAKEEVEVEVILGM